MHIFRVISTPLSILCKKNKHLFFFFIVFYILNFIVVSSAINLLRKHLYNIIYAFLFADKLLTDFFNDHLIIYLQYIIRSYILMCWNDYFIVYIVYIMVRCVPFIIITIIIIIVSCVTFTLIIIIIMKWNKRRLMCPCQINRQNDSKMLAHTLMKFDMVLEIFLPNRTQWFVK